MKAIIYHNYGSPDELKLEEVERPIPKDDEVLVKIYAVSVNSADLHLLRADPFLIRLSSGLLKPKNKILGSDIAGRVEAVGRNINLFNVGDDVFGDISGCGWGGFAEYACAREEALVSKPANLTFEEAAAVPMAAVTALQGLRNKVKIQPGQKVVINGSSGGVGTFAVQIAKTFGAEVTAVCSTRNKDLMRSIGADHIIDYTTDDFTQNGQGYDLILATNGDRSISDYQRALNPHGTYVMSGGSMAQMSQAMMQGPFISMSGTKKMGNLLAKPNHSDLTFIKGLLESRKIKPIIDKRYPFTEVPAALRYLEEGHAQGKVVITIAA
jgi:NADPH:quinone reductase-like Zn-dependent oxidoreductase